jgi:hypothetical protein
MVVRQDPGTADEDEAEIERAVLAYLQRHPLAADTLRGIVNWWLPQHRYEGGCRRIECVLVRLADEGVLHRDELPDGEVLYALNRHALSPH